ncbi:MAG TPA: N-acetyl-gamma-glutamyl-phosphate reductase [Myxococcales bacterium]|nr:N-acetyl-gamma-glutamyl-phosphate reductase [Deltaproteobacteria bacterium]HAA53188.1 N-acetyl-gamma-glutamyl-phosphate reductase [Myxococcales bacterium]|tara:strand:+ start:5349 stop:6380 length:1032 start_codon:yes stop_codon:yes gene_type:complete
METVKAGIIGGSGYGGSELLRLLLGHPHVEIVFATAHSKAGKRVDEVHPNLRGLTELVFQSNDEQGHWGDVDVLFVGLPHNKSMQIIPSIPEGVKVIDLGGDFRLRDQAIYEHYYKCEHSAFSLQSKFAYGLTESNKEQIATSDYVANPGCFATATLMGLSPLISQKLLTGKIVVDAKTGSSGSGNQPSAGTHHPKRSNSFYAYKSYAHRHQPEIEQWLRQLDPTWSQPFVFQTHSAPMVRGIFASIYATLRQPMTHDEVAEAFSAYYADAWSVRLVGSSPDVNWVKTTQFTDIGWAVDGAEVTVFVAIDNLVKGASGQAIHNMNVMMGLPEKAGLFFPGTHP